MSSSSSAVSNTSGSLVTTPSLAALHDIGKTSSTTTMHHDDNSDNSSNNTMSTTSTPSAKRVKRLSQEEEKEPECRSVTPHNSCVKSNATTKLVRHDDDNDKEDAKNKATIILRQFLQQQSGYKDGTATVVSQNKRTDYIGWNDYFMAMAVLSAMRSKDPHHATGCCIVDKRHRIIGIGYNGFPMHCSDDVLPWGQASSDAKGSVPFLHTYQPYVVHAIVNAILCSGDCQGARLYVSEYPCAECAKTIIQAGISQVVFMGNNNNNNALQAEDDHDESSASVAASQIMFQLAGVQVTPFVPTQDKVKLVRPTGTSIPPPPPQPDTTRMNRPEDDGTDAEALLSSQQRELVRREANLDPNFVSTKRSNALSWDDYFMWMAFLTAQRSKDPNTQVGACLVLNKRIVGLGYNGFPTGCCDDLLPWARQGPTALHTKYPFVCHAEVNAILNRIFPNVQGATLYVALFPCNECTKFIIQAGIREVVYLDDKYHDTDICRASRIMLGLAGVKLRQHTPALESLVIPLDDNNNNNGGGGGGGENK